MHNDFIETGAHGGTQTNPVDVTPFFSNPPGTANAVPYTVHGVYILLNNLNVGQEHTFFISYRYLTKWNGNYANDGAHNGTNGGDFNVAPNNKKCHIRLGWGAVAFNGVSSADDSAGASSIIDYNGTLGQGITQTTPYVDDWGGVTGAGPYYSLIEGKLDEEIPSYTMRTKAVTFTPANANNNVIMLSIGHGFKLDIEYIKVFCA